jgi:hypothetical protein
MAVIGFTLFSINAEKFDMQADSGSKGGEINVNSSPKIKELKEVTLPNLKKKALSMDFEFLTTYDPKIGEIKINGNLLLLADKNEPILEQWKKNKSIPQAVSVEVLNYLFKKCLLKISNVAEDLQLPPPIQFPVIKPKQKEEPGYVG